MDAFLIGCEFYCVDCAPDDAVGYAYGGGEADAPQHCANCHVHLENPLTTDGYAYARELIIDGTGDKDVLATWAKYYEIKDTGREIRFAGAMVEIELDLVVEDKDTQSCLPVFHIPGLNFVAEGVTNSKQSKAWNIFDRDTHEFVCQLRGVDERNKWLASAARAADVPTNATHL